MKEVFDKMYQHNENYAERLAADVQQLAEGTKVAVRLGIIAALCGIASFLLIICSCIKYLFFN